MALFSFYNMRKPRQFDHKPIYWDPHKEALEERISKVKREMGVEEPLEEYKPHIKGTFIEGTSHLKKSVGRGEGLGAGQLAGAARRGKTEREQGEGSEKVQAMIAHAGSWNMKRERDRRKPQFVAIRCPPKELRLEFWA